MRVDAFDFELPDERIALRPADPRESAKLLSVGDTGRLADHTVGELPDLLDPGDVLVFNDTRVIPARLFGRRQRADGTGDAAIEATLHQQADVDRWQAFLRPAKRIREGDRLRFLGEETQDAFALEASVVQRSEGGQATLAFDRQGPELAAAIGRIGHLPLPPYIARQRPDDAQDRADYQTVYAREDGAVAAPTAGLHFTPDLFGRLDARGLAREYLTLHVGAGTFLPVKADDTSDHAMHSEAGRITPDLAKRLTQARMAGRRLVAVGTTSLRLLESAAEPDGTIRPFDGPTDIFITPGYRFKAVDRLLTNFHLPRSTLFMLVCAFSGFETMHAAYDHAIGSHYRFYSYGDACLLDRAATS